MRRAVAEGGVVAVHCCGGLGRTGTLSRSQRALWIKCTSSLMMSIGLGRSRASMLPRSRSKHQRTRSYQGRTQQATPVDGKLEAGDCRTPLRNVPRRQEERKRSPDQRLTSRQACALFPCALAPKSHLRVEVPVHNQELLPYLSRSCHCLPIDDNYRGIAESSLRVHVFSVKSTRDEGYHGTQHEAAEHNSINQMILLDIQPIAIERRAIAEQVGMIRPFSQGFTCGYAGVEKHISIPSQSMR